MNPRDWLLAAFIVAGIVGVSAMWMAETLTKREAARSSIEAVKIALTPFERDRRKAIEKAKHAGIDPRWAGGEE